jgi:drug/metabolite transporter (DMT)-like permease
MDIPAAVLALLSALSSALATTLQQRGALDTPAGEDDPRFLVQVLVPPVWLLGGVFQLLGWVLQAIALGRGTFVMVQALLSLSLVFALPLGVRLTNQRVGPRSVAGALLALIGIIAFILVGQPEGGASKPDGTTVALWGVVAVVTMLVLARLAYVRSGPRAAALFGTAAGIGFGVQAAATKIFMGVLGTGVAAILGSLATYTLIITALAGFGLQQSALKSGYLAPAMAATNASALTTSVLLGVVIFGESIAAAGHLPFTVAALTVTVIGVVLLAEAESDREPRDGGPASPQRIVSVASEEPDVIVG